MVSAVPHDGKKGESRSVGKSHAHVKESHGHAKESHHKAHKAKAHVPKHNAPKHHALKAHKAKDIKSKAHKGHWFQHLPSVNFQWLLNNRKENK